MCSGIEGREEKDQARTTVTYQGNNRSDRFLKGMYLRKALVLRWSLLSSCGHGGCDACSEVPIITSTNVNALSHSPTCFVVISGYPRETVGDGREKFLLTLEEHQYQLCPEVYKHPKSNKTRERARERSK